MSTIQIKGLKDGKTQVTARNGEATSVVEVEVVEARVSVLGKGEVPIGEDVLLRAGLVTGNGRFGQLVWSSRNGLVKIEPSSMSAIITGDAPGPDVVVLKWMYQGLEFEGTLDVEVIGDVNPAITELYLYPNTYSGPVGDYLLPTLSYYPLNATIPSMKWEVADPTVAKVEAGKISIIGLGTTAISVTVGDATADMVVTGREAKVAPTSLTWASGQSHAYYELSLNSTWMTSIQIAPPTAEPAFVITPPAKAARIEIGDANASGRRTLTIRGQVPGDETVTISSMLDPTKKITLRTAVSGDYLLIKGLEEPLVLNKEVQFTVSKSDGTPATNTKFDKVPDHLNLKVIEKDYKFSLKPTQPLTNYNLNISGEINSRAHLFASVFLNSEDTSPDAIKIISDIPFSVEVPKGSDKTFSITTEQKDVDFYWAMIAGSGHYDKEDVGNETGTSVFTARNLWAGDYIPKVEVKIVSRSTQKERYSFCKIRVR